MRFLCLLLLFFATGAGAAEPAADSPRLAPPPAWVTTVPMPAPNPALRQRPVQALLAVTEGRYARDGSSEYYVENATLVQTPEGLAALGNLVIGWKPETAELVVHKVRILRDGKEIDLLAGGQKFTVLRRENNLESAALDGVLTAVMQPEGLSVGDVLTIAYTLRSKPTAIAFQPEDIVTMGHGFPIRRLHHRQLWEKGVPIRWSATDAMGKPKVAKTDWGTELVLDRNDAEGPEPPKGAPSRFMQPARLEVTGYGDWSDISRLLAPAYAAAGVLAPDSAIRAEIDRIAQASPDPKRRMMAALRLVEDKVRYFALTIGDGGYVPATADQTWSRKFADCKGKTVLLLALLSGLGIEAEPVLVNTVAGDSLAVRLPQVNAFDHVIVRARIASQDYWLDGTRSGDRDIAALVSTPFVWGLPLRSSGAKLEALPLVPPALPLAESRVTYDASKGFFLPTPVTGEIVYRGDMAIALRLMHQQLGSEEFAKRAREFARDAPESEDVKFDFKSDEESGTFTIAFKGTPKLSWTGGFSPRSFVYRFDSDTIRWEPDFERASGVDRDAPFSLAFPIYLSSTETIILPGSGAGFMLEGKSFDRTVAGTRIARTISLEKGRAEARSVFQVLKPEVGAAEAKAAQAALKEVNADVAGVRATDTYEMTEADRKAMLEKEPENATGYNQRGYERLQKRELNEALADFDKAASLSPQWSMPVANRAVVLVHQNKLAEARTALAKAEALPGQNAIIWQAWGMLHLAENRPQDAVEALTRSLAIEPGNGFTLARRIYAYEQLGKLTEALEDLKRALEIKPDNAELIAEAAAVEAGRGNAAAAVAAAERLVALQPGRPGPLLLKARLLSRFGRKEEAGKAFAESLAAAGKLPAESPEARRARADLQAEILFWSGEPARAIETLSEELRRQPNDARLLNSRCWKRATANLELDKAVADCRKALSIAPDRPSTLDSLAFAELRLGRLEEAVANFDKALALAPRQAASWYGRGIARLRQGRREAGEKDLAEARRLYFDVDEDFRAFGLAPSPQATAGPD